MKTNERDWAGKLFSYSTDMHVDGHAPVSSAPGSLENLRKPSS